MSFGEIFWAYSDVIAANHIKGFKFFSPPHICSLGEFLILFDALWLNKNRLTGQILIFEFLPGALVTILMPNCVGYPAYSFYAVNFFVWHGAIVAYILAKYLAGEIRPRYVGIWQSMIAVYMQIIPVYFLDKAYDINYMFLMEHQDNPVLKLCWNLSGGKGGIPYIIALSVLVIVVMHVFYLLYKVREWIWKKGRKKEQ